jgi:signal transduction histidine kinase
MINSFFAGAGLALFGLAMTILMLILFSRKNKTNWTLRTTTFLISTVTTILVLISEIAISYTILHRGTHPTLNEILCRADMFLTFFWFFIATLYVIVAFSKEEESKKIKIHFSMYIFISIAISLLLSIFLKLNFIDGINGNPAMIGSPYARIVKILSIISSTIHVTMFFYNKNKVKNLNLNLLYYLLVVYVFATLFLIFFAINMNTLSITLALTLTILFLSLESQDAKILEEYEETRLKAIKSDEAKSMFLVNMSHEIRSPLTSIIGFSQSLCKKQNLTEEEMKHDLNYIQSEVSELLLLSNDITEISKLDSNEYQIEEHNYNINDILDISHRYIDPQVEKKGNINFSSSVANHIPLDYVGDPATISKIVCYLLSNALEYTFYGEIKLTVNSRMVSRGTFELEIIVSNTGHLMTEENFNRSFDDYIELKDVSGNGIRLGLVIAKKLINLLNGKIEFINEKGQGTKYIFKLEQKVAENATYSSNDNTKEGDDNNAI